MKPKLALALVAVTGQTLLATARSQGPLPASYDFVEDVLLCAERGTNVKRCRRFVDSPSVALVTSAGREKPFEAAVTAINDALAPTRFSLRTLFPQTAKPQIKCYYADGPAAYAHIRQSNWLKTPPDDWTWDVKWDGFSRLTEGYVLIRSDGVTDDVLQYRTTRALLGALGFNGWSSAISDSIFSHGRNTITPTDKQLVGLFYSHVAPGARAFELRKAIGQFWAH